MVSYASAAVALSPSCTISPDQSDPRSPTLDAVTCPVCVKTARNPDWAGTIDSKDCAEAIGRLWDQVLPYGYIHWTFWASTVDWLFKIIVS